MNGCGPYSLAPAEKHTFTVELKSKPIFRVDIKRINWIKATAGLDRQLTFVFLSAF